MRLHGRLLIEGALRSGVLEMHAGQITNIELDEPAWNEESLPVIAPGMIDLHIHGFDMCDPLQDLAGMGRALAKRGTTAFLPTLFPAQPTELGKQCRAFEKAREALVEGAAHPIGLHLEGPFVNPDAAGALPLSELAIPSVAALREILGPNMGSGNGVKTITLAPELPGALDLVRELEMAGVRASLGHSRASATEGRRATKAGASGITHLYNAMSGIHHRNMGLAGLALTDDLLYAEIIGDLVHVGREAFELALAARGPGGLCLVSDALMGAGTGCDHFHSRGIEHVIRGGAAYYPGTDEHPEPQLAGSALCQLEMVQRLCREGVLDIAEALTMACTTPARALGLLEERGVLNVGARADLLVLKPATYELQQVYVAGERLES
ncbi:MAG: N-acetylglucosamine-6-phosphate deacetylase [Candidatus Paceibacteria bacterium]|jgi:N-acetylglucosamine-6-phosphate deacetylase